MRCWVLVALPVLLHLALDDRVEHGNGIDSGFEQRAEVNRAVGAQVVTERVEARHRVGPRSAQLVDCADAGTVKVSVVSGAVTRSSVYVGQSWRGSFMSAATPSTTASGKAVDRRPARRRALRRMSRKRLPPRHIW